MARAKSPSPAPSPKVSPRKLSHSILPPPPNNSNPAVVVNGAHAKNIPTRPPLRNNFDLEPNPFEQSFASTSSVPRSSLSSIRDNNNPTDDARSHQRQFNSPNESNVRRKSPSASSTGSHHSRKHSSESVTSNGNGHQSATNGDTPKPILPPLASLTSPSEQSYPWAFSAGLANSLRSGPLSPAMLTGPQQHQSSTTSVAAPLFGFDPSGTFRTGLTPSTGLTPLVGGPVAFPPPSPNTAAAFYALVNGSAGAGVGPNASTITPNTLTALAGVLQANAQPSLASSTAAAPSASNPSQGSTTAGVNAGSANTAPTANQSQAFEGANSQSSRFPSSFTQPNANQSQGKSSSQENSNDANAAANGLFLLSQAHQELAKREEAQKQNQTQQQQSQAELNGKRGSKRKSDAAATAPSSTADSVASAKTAPASKRTRTTSTQGVSASTRGAAARRGSAAASISTSAGDADLDEVDDEDEDDDDDMGDGGGVGSTKGGKSQSSQSKKPETEEEKRRNFLERNRQAALKCRQRKKAWLAQLQAKVEYLTNENEQLKSALVSSREEIARLTALVGGAGVGMAGVSVNGAGIPVVGMVGVPMHHRMHAPTHHTYTTHHVPHGHHGPPVSVNVSLPPGASASSASTSPTHGHHNGNGARSGSGSPHSPSSDGRSSSVASVHGVSHSMSHSTHSRSHSGNTHGIGAIGPQPVAATGGGMTGRGYGY